MRKAIVLLAICCLFLLMAGCSSHKKPNTSAPSPATGQNQPAAAPLTTTNLPAAANQNQQTAVPPTTVNSPAPPVAAQPASQFLANLNIKMIDDKSGWAWDTQAVFRTSDGGAVWTEVTPVSDRISQENCPSLYGRFFLDSNRGGSPDMTRENQLFFGRWTAARPGPGRALT
jgi:hypothetical protein